MDLDIDSEDPTITCAADQTQTAAAGICTAAVTVIAPTTADNCSVASITNDFNNAADASGNYPVGLTTVVWTVTDANGRTANCSQDITVTDDEDSSTPDEGHSISILGHCDDLDGNIDSTPCGDTGDCQNCSNSQFTTQDECLFNEDGSATGNIWGGGCLDDNSGQLAYLQLPIHIEENTEFTVGLEVEDGDGDESNIVEFVIDVLARYVSRLRETEG